MGLFRKMTSIGTLGLVDFRSDKERTAAYTRATAHSARQTAREMKRQTQLMKADHYATHYGAPSQQQPVLPQRPSAAAWFPDPGGQSFLRWWDGTQWTGHVQAFPPPPGQSAERQQ